MEICHFYSATAPLPFFDKSEKTSMNFDKAAQQKPEDY